MSEVRCSVCMATYNGERYIARQLESIISQLSSEDEIVISDDGSSDRTLEIARNIQTTSLVPMRIIEHRKEVLPRRKRGKNYIFASGNFENCITAANGKYLFLSDQDDVWLSNKVDLFLRAFNEGAMLVFSNYSVCDEHENIITTAYFNGNPQRWTFLHKNISPLYWGCCMAFKAEILKWILPFPKNLYCHDAFIGLTVSLLARNKIHFIDIPTLLYRRHLGTVSTGTKKSVNPFWFKLCWRLSLLFDVIGRVLKIKIGEKS